MNYSLSSISMPKLRFKSFLVVRQILSGGSRVEVVVAEEMPSATKRVLIEVACGLEVAEHVQLGSQIEGRLQGVGVVASEQAASTVEGV